MTPTEIIVLSFLGVGVILPVMVKIIDFFLDQHEK